MQHPKDRLREAIKSYYYHYCYLGVERYSALLLGTNDFSGRKACDQIYDSKSNNKLKGQLDP